MLTAPDVSKALQVGGYAAFSASTCGMLVRIFDAHGTGGMDPSEFEMCWRYLQDWKRSFDSYDRDHSGTIEMREFQEALTAMGYRFSPPFYALLMAAFSNQHCGRFAFDNFIQANCELQILSSQFKRLDQDSDGIITVNLEQFLSGLMAGKAMT